MIVKKLTRWKGIFNILLLPGEELCPDCDGDCGFTEEDSTGHAYYVYCELCKGQGKIDWIQKSMGVQS